jgi:uncharacterized membrane protein (UPF0182 family)
MKKIKKLFLAIIIVMTLYFLIENFIYFYIDWLWYEETGYTDTFLVILKYKFLAGLIMGTIFIILIGINLYIIRRLSPRIVRFSQSNIIEILDSGVFETQSVKLLVLIIGIFSIFIAMEGREHWQDLLFYCYGQNFNINDPVFGIDLAFYLFKLPLLKYIYSWLIFTFIVIFISITSIYLFYKLIRYSPGNILTLSGKVKIHLSILGSIIFILKAWGIYLARYELLYSRRGVIYGATYTDVHVQIPVMNIMIVMALLCSIIILLNLYIKNWKIIFWSTAIYIIFSLLGGSIYPGLIQQFVVVPNEIGKEKEFIKRNIEYTLKGYGLDKVIEKEFPANETLSAESIYKNEATIKNIRLWDERPLLETYAQLQEIRPYYDFVDVDVDRYTIDGDYRQVMLSAREIAYEQLSTGDWINQHITYTHGYGLCLSPVNSISKEGLPEFFIKDIPPVCTTNLIIDRPEIYYGETTKKYSIVKTKASDDNMPQEFDYPSGTTNKYCSYQGSGGIALSSFVRKLAFARHINSMKILLNKDIKDDSKIMIYKDLNSRIKKAFPMMIYSNDPYIIIADGKLLWICDAYTISNKYPYSMPYNFREDYKINYIRNSVKVVVNAYNGNIDFYKNDPYDPVINTYEKMFPYVFKDMSEMPEAIKSHIRYPEELMAIQSKIYSTYHMKEPQVFYNKEDMWNIPKEISDTQKEDIKPYYIIMSLPEEKKEEFMLMMPFTPMKKDNLSAWMCARCDKDHYGDIILYRFPKKKMVYGPGQIEARINQDTEISKQLSLWNQQGSSVIKGNLLVIPLENSLIYVEPLYLKADKGQLPELKKVILVYGSQIVMEDNLEKAIKTMFNTSDKHLIHVTEKARTMEVMAGEALKHYEKAMEYMKSGNWSGYGDEIEDLGRILSGMVKGELKNDMVKGGLKNDKK